MGWEDGIKVGNNVDGNRVGEEVVGRKVGDWTTKILG